VVATACARLAAHLDRSGRACASAWERREERRQRMALQQRRQRPLERTLDGSYGPDHQRGGALFDSHDGRSRVGRPACLLSRLARQDQHRPAGHLHSSEQRTQEHRLARVAAWTRVDISRCMAGADLHLQRQPQPPVEERPVQQRQLQQRTAHPCRR
jgi:hypothetical protein